MKSYHLAPEHEVAYMEERKNKCEHCQPEHEYTTKWLESVSNQDLLYTVYSEYGINPNTVYLEFEAEITMRKEERIIPELAEEVA